MATPTTYSLSYDAPCEVEAGCGDAPCGGKPEYISRPQVFCRDAQILANLTVNGDTFVQPPQIYVGGKLYVPTLIDTNIGSIVVLAQS